ncbi:deoxyribodipyrimidine photo-lyase [Gammaproteobacteria bacterium]|nr:deoxyribodipyrimidine photo-lyase [Gammaproteobacteria bacterium]MDA8798881.1 deoxyribodipyrimidine photo-lyase [Gammaproteobacteria bacterium]
MTKGLIWYRSDLRLDDNPALSHALLQCEEVLAVYVFSNTQWELHNESNIKHHFLINNLKLLKESLAELSIPIIVINTETYQTLPKDFCSFSAEHKVDSVFWNNEFGYNESKRDQFVREALEKININTSQFNDQVIYEPGFLKTGQGNAFSVFTPYKRRWVENFDMNFLDIAKVSKPRRPSSIRSDLSALKFVKTHSANIDLWPAGESAAQEKLANFLQSKANSYSESRNSPIIDGTSRISPYLALGILSPKRCILEGLKLNNFEFTSGNKGICKWIDEIVWREFYRNIMHSFPKVSKNQPFQDYTKSIQWRHSSKDLEAFYKGKTGFPIVDAGIRQMLSEGWMHNRLRMVVAMFFTKNMLHDWRLGEKFFMQNLIDGDFSSNNGGWQWSSSTGTDSAPYFRIFNPITQSQNFDPKGEFIKKFIPELKDVPVAQIHQPKSDLFLSTNYPAPILDLKESRIRAIQAFKDARENTSI